MSARRAAAALALLAAAPAAGYVRSTSETGAALAWGTPVVSYHHNLARDAALPPALAPSCEPTGAGDPALAALRASFGAWRVSCTELEPVDAGPLAEIRTGTGGTAENLVVVRRGWCSSDPDAVAHPCWNDPDVDCGEIFNCFEDRGGLVDRGTLALTSVLYYPDTGRIVDADIQMNGWDGAGGPITVGDAPPAHGWYFTCNDPRLGQLDALPICTSYGQAGCYYADFQNTLTHEVGHFIGLRHVCWGGGAADLDLPDCDDPDPRVAATYAQITMYPLTAPGVVTMRDLHPDDEAGVCAIYPSTDGGGCGCGAGGAPGALAALLALAALWPRRRPRGGRDQATSTPA